MRLLSLSLLILVAGCATTIQGKAQQTLITTCNAFDAAQVTVTQLGQAGKLSAATIIKAAKISKEADAICGDTTPPDVTSAVNIVNGLTQQLKALVGG